MESCIESDKRALHKKECGASLSLGLDAMPKFYKEGKKFHSPHFLLSLSSFLFSTKKAFLHHYTTPNMILTTTTTATTTNDSTLGATSTVTTSRREDKSALWDDHETSKESCMAPLSLPFKRRLEMGSIVMWHCSSFYLMAFFFYNWTRPFLLPLAVIYLIYMVLDRSPERGGRPFPWIRRWSLWKHMAEYFPIQIIKVVTSLFFSLHFVRLTN
jgi:hypothetical protein